MDDFELCVQTSFHGLVGIILHPLGFGFGDGSPAPFFGYFNGFLHFALRINQKLTGKHPGGVFGDREIGGVDVDFFGFNIGLTFCE
jgi:hypothetical protein